MSTRHSGSAASRGSWSSGAFAHLRSIGCTKAVLHSSDAGEQLYTSLGFERAKEMRLPL